LATDNKLRYQALQLAKTVTQWFALNGALKQIPWTGKALSERRARVFPCNDRQDAGRSQSSDAYPAVMKGNILEQLGNA
jgi:hypothetical protein